jgi:predicted Fe-Mo cluster-binding NifX family protein
LVLVQPSDMRYEAVLNVNGALGEGAGIQSARLVAERGVKVVLTGNVGPNAHQALSAAGIEVVVGCSGTVSEAVERFKSGQLRAASAPNVAGHSGMGGGRR